MIIGKVKNNKSAKDYFVNTKLVKIDKEYLLDYYVKLAIQLMCLQTGLEVAR